MFTSAFRKLSSIYVFSYFPFGFEGRIWDLIVSVPDHCLSFYFLCLSLRLTGHTSISIINTGQEINSTAILDLPLLQVEQMSITNSYCLNT